MAVKYIHLLVFVLVSLISNSQKQSENGATMKIVKAFPKKEDVITPDFSKYDNFFPIATVEVKGQERAVQIQIIYTFLEGTNADEDYFLEGEYGGNFSFKIVDNRCRPTLKKQALKINDDYKQFLEEAKKKYNSANKGYIPLEFRSKPEWWQGDDTPLNKAGEEMEFVCQVDLVDIVDDDCRMFIFYDSRSNTVRTVYQRD